MTATAISFPNEQRNSNGLLSVLKYAACEWILIFLLFVDAAFSYMLTSFAKCCDLQIPCILFSRLDHVFGSVKDGFYRNLFCRNHRSEISFLLSCNIHDKLVDGRSMCDECLSSHVEGHDSNLDMQRLFAGKLGYDGKCCSPNLVLDMAMRLCLCCDKPWAPRPDSHRLSHGTAVSKSNIHLPRSISSPNDLKKMSYMCCAPAVSHVGDTDELKITFESKSRFPSADNPDGNGVVRDLNENEPKKQSYADESRDARCLSPASENTEKMADEKGNFNELPGLISLDDCTSPIGLVDSFSASFLADLISLVDPSNPDDAKDVSIESFSDNSSKTGARSEAGRIVDFTSMLSSTAADRSAPEFVTKYMLAYTNGANGDLKSLSTETQTGPHADRVAVQTLPVSGEEKSASEFDAKSNGINGDLKSLPAQNSSGEENQLSLNYLSPRLQDRAVELLRTDSNSVEVRNLQNLFIEAITESPELKPFDESSVIEGESRVDMLQRQFDDAREYINALSKELEEERSAAAIAANQAMAMITRLQEEKAALRMEALQYLRMMEEQAEYDVDALEKANELLIEKDTEIQDLEAELEYYRSNFPDEIPEESGAVNLDKEHGPTVNTTTCSKKDDIENSSETEFPEACVVDHDQTAWSEIEDEKLYISQMLQKLEKKLNRLAQYRGSEHNSDGEQDEKRERKAPPMANGTGEEDGDHDCNENGLEDLENEISELNERMEALEADCSFLQRSLNSLKSGKEGLVLIQEILHLLREVKKIGLKTIDPSDL
ncbi:hypothetical protein V6N13_128198 [Hibiscus sabdariffa]|uniref:GTD-binding domain-containing protein n=1 Tax=Hibiscus sabdariffa TaxID=183260 RepID=A0ABR2P1N3_9ROSI